MDVRTLARQFPGSFSRQPEDVVSIIVRRCKPPAMRSLAQVSKSFNEHLKERHHLDKVNRKTALNELEHHNYPLLRTLDMASTLAESGSEDLLKRFLRHLPMGDPLPPKSIFLSALSSRTGLSFENSVQAELQKSSWKKSSPLESVDQLSQWCMPLDDSDRLPFEEVFGMIKNLPDRVKACAFTRLVYDLERMKLLDATNHEMSRKKKTYLKIFKKMATELLPVAWSPWLAEPNHLPASPVRHQSFAFIGAAVVCYRYLRGNNKHRFGEALLRLVMSAARDLPEDSRKWKSLKPVLLRQQVLREGKILVGNHALREGNALEVLLVSVFRFAFYDDFYDQLVKVLTKSGFLSRSKINWMKFDHDVEISIWTSRI